MGGLGLLAVNALKRTGVKEITAIDIDQKKLNNAIDTTSFKSLQNIENAGKFGENVYSLKDNRKIKFFYQGPENDWKKNLDENMIKKMNEYYKNDLKFFQYEK